MLYFTMKAAHYNMIFHVIFITSVLCLENITVEPAISCISADQKEKSEIERWLLICTGDDGGDLKLGVPMFSLRPVPEPDFLT